LNKTYSKWHIRIDELYHDNNNFLTQYHCTAYTQDDSSNVHFHFSEKDELIECIRDKQKIKPKDLAQVLESICPILEIVYPIVGNLRDAQRETVLSLEEEYSKLEKELEDLDISNFSYKEIVTKIIHVLENLKNYTDHYEKIRSFFNAVSKNLIESHAISQTKLENSDLQNPDPQSDPVSDEAQEDRISKNSKPTTKQKNLAPDIDIQSLIQEATTTLAELTNLRKKSNASEEVLKLFLDFDEQISTLLEKSMTTQKDVASILRLIKERNALGKNLFARYLLNYDFDQAEKLIGYLSDKWITISLKKDDAALLNFLLTHSNFPINTRTITINEKQWLPIQFCVDRLMQKTNQDKTKVERCLSILIKHGASVLTPYHGTAALLHIIVYLSQDEESSLSSDQLLTNFLNIDTAFAKQIREIPKNYYKQLKNRLEHQGIDKTLQSLIDSLALPHCRKIKGTGFDTPTTVTVRLDPNKRNPRMLHAVLNSINPTVVSQPKPVESALRSQKVKRIKQEIEWMEKLSVLLNAWKCIQEKYAKSSLDILFQKLNQFSDLTKIYFKIGHAWDEQLSLAINKIDKICFNCSEEQLNEINKLMLDELKKLRCSCENDYWFFPMGIATEETQQGSKKEKAVNFFKPQEKPSKTTTASRPR
jgi:hypothetical protein